MEIREPQFSRRIKQLQISGDLLVGMCMEDDGRPRYYRVIRDALPEDARIVNVVVGTSFNPGWPGVLTLIIESETFPEIDPIAEIPLINPVFQTIYPEEQ